MSKLWYQHAQWQGQCNSCKQWNTLTEEVEKTDKKDWKSENKAGKISKPRQINQIEISSESRINTGDAELNRVLGGGIIPGALMLLGGEPGIGKSHFVANCHDRGLQGPLCIRRRKPTTDQDSLRPNGCLFRSLFCPQ